MNPLSIPRIILASQSPRRKMMLEWAEVPFTVMVKHSDETFPPHLPPEEAAIHIAKEKAMAVQKEAGQWAEGRENEQKHFPILAADTMVVLTDEILGKPLSREDAINMLQKLSGTTHKVITGVCILNGSKEITFADTTTVSFHPLSSAQIEYYVDQYQPYDKAGGYAIQEWIGVVGIERIEGDFYNVMGLPVSRVLQALQKL